MSSTTTTTNRTFIIDTPAVFKTGTVIAERAVQVPNHDGAKVVWVDTNTTEGLVRWTDGTESWVVGA